MCWNRSGSPDPGGAAPAWGWERTVSYGEQLTPCTVTRRLQVARPSTPARKSHALLQLGTKRMIRAWLCADTDTTLSSAALTGSVRSDRPRPHTGAMHHRSRLHTLVCTLACPGAVAF